MKTFLSFAVWTGFLATIHAADPRPNILFCIADDWGWPHAGAYGDPVVKTPAFDRLAAEGALFHHAYISSPSCAPSRNAILTGQWHWRLGEGASLYGSLNQDLAVYPHLLQDAGYHIGSWRKSHGPGKLTGKWAENHPAGKVYPKGMEQFLAARPEGAPFCFWLGTSDPHRPYDLHSGRESGMDLSKIKLFPHFPDSEAVIENQDRDETHRRAYDLSFARRPAEELYDLRMDPDQLIDVAGNPEYAGKLAALGRQLTRELAASGDPRHSGKSFDFDAVPYIGGAPKHPDAEATGKSGQKK